MSNSLPANRVEKTEGDFLTYVQETDFGEDDVLKKAFLVYAYEGKTDAEALDLLSRDVVPKLNAPVTPFDEALRPVQTGDGSWRRLR